MARTRGQKMTPSSMGNSNDNPTLKTESTIFLKCNQSKCGRIFHNPISYRRHMTHSHTDIMANDKAEIYEFCKALSELDSSLVCKIISFHKRGLVNC